tara:strand:+ start:7987 stop:8190 length:204 start_codon:yes stop_codon:yes gene_type:complete
MEWLIGLLSLGGLWLVFVVVGLFRQRIDIVEEEAEHLSGVIKNNVKADNAKSGSDLDNIVREKYGSR